MTAREPESPNSSAARHGPRCRHGAGNSTVPGAGALLVGARHDAGGGRFASCAVDLAEDGAQTILRVVHVDVAGPFTLACAATFFEFEVTAIRRMVHSGDFVLGWHAGGRLYAREAPYRSKS